MGLVSGFCDLVSVVTVALESPSYVVVGALRSGWVVRKAVRVLEAAIGSSGGVMEWRCGIRMPRVAECSAAAASALV